MTVLVMADVPGQTVAGYDGMLDVLAERVRQAPGFVLHSAYVVDGAWRVLEVWRSKAEADRFFAQQVAPHLPPGVHPKRKLFEAHSLVLAADGISAPDLAVR
jgi:quinol monooxygenase YgiN